MNYATKWTVTEAYVKVTAIILVTFIIDRICTKYESPRTIISDNSPQFISDVFAHLM